jgi:hypothetical protein
VLSTSQSKQFQIGDSINEVKGANSRHQVKKEAASAASSQRASNDGALPASPFRRGGQSLNQQTEIAKLVAARSMEDRRSLDSSFSTQFLIFKRKSILAWISPSKGE